MKPFDFSQNIRGVGVLIRASLNVPIQNGVVTNTFRLEKALMTIEKLREAGARVVVLGHIGRDPTNTLRPVFEIMQKRTHTQLIFSDEVVGEKVCRAVEALKPGEVLILENVRRHKGETENSSVFAEQLASYGSIYINDAFSDSHRAHASIVGIPKYIPGFAGPAFIEEYRGIAPAQKPEQPNVAIVGGAKFLTKEPLIRTLLNSYEKVFVGGAIAHDFFLAQGFEVGRSLVSRSSGVYDLIDNPKLILPTDVIVLGPDGTETKSVEEVSPNDRILDAGPKTLEALNTIISSAKTILWNGPLGNFEEGYNEGTEMLAKMIARAPGVSIVGGGETVAAIHSLGLNNQFTHVSTAGGAMLDFIATGTLPGIEALGWGHATIQSF